MISLPVAVKFCGGNDASLYPKASASRIFSFAECGKVHDCDLKCSIAIEVFFALAGNVKRVSVPILM